MRELPPRATENVKTCWPSARQVQTARGPYWISISFTTFGKPQMPQPASHVKVVHGKQDERWEAPRRKSGAAPSTGSREALRSRRKAIEIVEIAEIVVSIDTRGGAARPGSSATSTRARRRRAAAFWIVAARVPRVRRTEA
jgi:hypothetical protein